MGIFAANPDAMRQKGVQIGDIAVQFQAQIDKIYENGTVELIGERAGMGI